MFVGLGKGGGGNPEGVRTEVILLNLIPAACRGGAGRGRGSQIEAIDVRGLVVKAATVVRTAVGSVDENGDT